MITETSVFQRSGPSSAALSSCIDEYLHFYHPQGKDLYKNILPCPGISLLFNFREMLLNGEACPSIVIIGLHEDVYRIESLSGEVETVVVKFSPWGCRQFINMPVSDLTNKVLDARQAFGDSIAALYDNMKIAQDDNERFYLLDNFFQARLKTPDAGYASIAMLADKLRKTPEHTSFAALSRKSGLPFSARQMARRFKEITGVNLQTYTRICRFGVAKSLFFERQELSMTDIGYLSGYYDQPHFSKEFKKLSGSNAKDFFLRCPFQRMLHEEQA